MWRRLARAIVRTTGLPQWIRGEVYLLPYWHLRGVFERLATVESLQPVLDPGYLPQADRGMLLRTAARHGWVGSSSTVDRRKSHRQLAKAIAAARTSAELLDPLSSLLDARALSMLEERAADTLAMVGRLRKAFSSKRMKLVVLPFDSPPIARAVVQAARDTDLPVLVVQHGFHADPNNPDKKLADALAVWAEEDARLLREQTTALVERTGNPGAVTPTTPNEGQASPRAAARTIVLVQYPSRLSARYDKRVGVQHVDTALWALATARPGSAVTIRPHPADTEPGIFARSAARYPDLKVSVDIDRSIGDLISQSDLCIGAVSTAALEAAAAGVPVIFLNRTRIRAPWPFDGSTDVPVATSAEELADLIPVVLSSGEVPGRGTMVEALGASPDATDRVISLIQRLSEGAISLSLREDHLLGRRREGEQ
jgi:hypothetical protein